MDIVSRANPLIVETAKLKNKKERDGQGLFAFEGIKLYAEAIRRDLPLRCVFATPEAAHELERFGRDEGCAYYTVSESVYEKLSFEKSPQGVFCTAAKLNALHGTASAPAGRTMILCDVRDPGNLGACVRTALALGLDSLILAGECADIYNPKCVRGSMGAVFSLKTVSVGDPVGAIGLCRDAGMRVFAAALTDAAVSLDSFPAADDVVFAVGNEGHGLSREFIEACDGCVVIPMQGGTESLNAAVAAGILMWETRAR